MNAIYILWLREVKRYLRSRVQIIFSLAQPTFYLLAFGFGFGPVFEKAGEGSYLQFLAPGVVGMTVLLSSMFSGIAVLWDRQFGFLKETLVAPVPRIYLMIGRTIGGATIGIFQGVLMLLVCILAGFRPQHWISLLPAFTFVVMSHLSRALSVITHIDPLSYGVDGLRGTLVGLWHFSYSLDIVLLCSLAAIFVMTGAYFFSKIEI
jgi:ABC-2 type transport system permease protein